MLFSDLVHGESLIITEGAIIERIRRSGNNMLDPLLLNSALIYTDAGQKLLAALHTQYIDIGMKYDLPIIVFTDTWRANSERMKISGIPCRDINRDCTRFLLDIVKGYGGYSEKIFTGGLVGCKGNAYNPSEALKATDAEAFHYEQIAAQADAGIDFLFAATIPSLSEAKGMALAMARTGVPYVISFILGKNGAILDGTTLARAIDVIDNSVSAAPLFYMSNCCHPTFYRTAMSDLLFKDRSALKRVIGLQANTSAKDASELDNLEYLDTADASEFAQSMMGLFEDFDTKILGGCCGTDNRHIEAIAYAYKQGRGKIYE